MSEDVKAITCPVCKNTCSSQAAACPKCGHPISPGAVRNKNTVAMESDPRKDPSRTALRILWTLFIISLFFGLSAIRTYNNMRYELIYDDLATRAARQAEILGIVIRIAIPAVLGVILVVVYAIRGRR